MQRHTRGGHTACPVHHHPPRQPSHDVSLMMHATSHPRRSHVPSRPSTCRTATWPPRGHDNVGHPAHPTPPCPRRRPCHAASTGTHVPRPPALPAASSANPRQEVREGTPSAARRRRGIGASGRRGADAGGGGVVGAERCLGQVHELEVGRRPRVQAKVDGGRLHGERASARAGVTLRTTSFAL